jgi:Diadenosine tetraphosphate (Ap4A) hydrolase and other HIT family hydrolases
VPRRQNPYAHLTAKEGDRPSFPTRKLLGLGHIEGRVLDYGCGHGADVDFLREKGVEVEGYDPHYAPERPDGTFDTILCHYVLNVLLQREQTDVLMDVSELLRPDGTAFYTVRRDLQRTGYRQHYKHNVPTYQTNVGLPYETVVRTEFCEIYQYRPYPQRPSDPETDCVLCNPPSETTLVSESAQSVAVRNDDSAADGHTLVLPKRHVINYFDLAEREQRACWLLVNRAQRMLREQGASNIFRVGLNLDQPAPKTVEHAHLHVLPL